MQFETLSVLDKIQASMNLLYELIEEMEQYPDKSLFYQDSRVLEGWLLLAEEIKEIKTENNSDKECKWELQSEYFAAKLIARRNLFSSYKELYHLYFDPLYNLYMNYSLEGNCISTDAIEALKADHYEKILDVEDIDEYVENVNGRSLDARYYVNKTMSYIYNILQAIMNKAGQVVIDINPSDEEFCVAIDKDLRGWTLNFGEKMFKGMREDLNRHYKEYRTAPYTPELWASMLDADEDALKKAKLQQLSECEDIKQEHWGDDMKKQMDDNDKLMSEIYSSCDTEELFDIKRVNALQHFIALLTQDNLSLFYEIIVRRNLIQCEMFPMLKNQHETWLEGNRYSESKREPNIEIGIRRALENLMKKTIQVDKKGKKAEEKLFNLQNHWQAVYRILVDKNYCMDADFEGFDSFIKRVMPKEVNKIYAKESVKQISKTDFNVPFNRWKYNGETSGKRKVYDRMFAVAQCFKELLEKEGL